MLGRDFQQPADVMLGQLAHVRRIAPRQIHANARGHQHLAHARLLARPLHQLDERAVIGAQQLANRRVHAAQPAAACFDLGRVQRI